MDKKARKSLKQLKHWIKCRLGLHTQDVIRPELVENYYTQRCLYCEKVTRVYRLKENALRRVL